MLVRIGLSSTGGGGGGLRQAPRGGYRSNVTFHLHAVTSQAELMTVKAALGGSGGEAALTRSAQRKRPPIRLISPAAGGWTIEHRGPPSRRHTSRRTRLHSGRGALTGRSHTEEPAQARGSLTPLNRDSWPSTATSNAAY